MCLQRNWHGDDIQPNVHAKYALHNMDHQFTAKPHCTVPRFPPFLPTPHFYLPVFAFAPNSSPGSHGFQSTDGKQYISTF